ncbi:MAG: hypothetical protein OHK0015_45620 [Chloroflexi bacterium OHK40]
MIAYNFHAAGNGADGTASAGHGKLAQLQAASGCPPYRAQQTGSGEQHLVAHLVATLGHVFPRWLLVTYYISLKTNPFVVITGREGAGKAAFASGVAAALVGQDSGQFLTIGSDSWARRGSQSSYYRAIHERFGASQFLEILHEAGAPENAGKIYMVLLKGLTLEELSVYVNRLLQVDSHGERRLALPGLPEAQRPIVPPNCLITATLHLPRAATPLDQEVLRHAGQIEFSPEVRFAQSLPPLPVPPVGLQRVMLATAGGQRHARARLVAILGRAGLRALGPSPAILRPLLAAGAVLSRQLREDTLAYVANSFDQDGIGLIDPTDARRNAQLAYDAQIVQRLLWRVDWRRRAVHHTLAALLRASGSPR